MSRRPLQRLLNPISRPPRSYGPAYHSLGYTGALAMRYDLPPVCIRGFNDKAALTVGTFPPATIQAWRPASVSLLLHARE
jgi:hypothetical protein